jgi:preprotein translocase subunit SecB
MSDEQQQPTFSIEKIYVKDLSLEIPHAPKVFMQRETPQIDVQLHNQGGMVEEGIYETVLTVTVTAKLAEDKTLFLVEVAQAGIFRLHNIPQADLEPILGITCPNILFPYVRETISDMVSRAGFPPVLLNPVNFELMYQQQQLQLQQHAEQPDAAAATTH